MGKYFCAIIFVHNMILREGNMRHYIYIVKTFSALIYLLFLALPSISLASTNVMQNLHTEKQKTNMLYAFSAEDGVYKDNVLILTGIKEVLFFSDEPKRIAGQITLERFQGIWDKKYLDGSELKPNAVLSIVNTPENTNITVELQAQSMDKHSLKYTVKILEGNIPLSFGRSTIFIDGIPTLVNGQITD